MKYITIVLSLLCYSTAGQVSIVWQIDTLPKFSPVDMSLDKDGNIIIAGNYWNVASSNFEFLVVKILPNSELSWKVAISQDNDLHLGSLALDDNANIYLSGSDNVLEEGVSTKMNKSGDSLWTTRTFRSQLGSAILDKEVLLVSSLNSDFIKISTDGVLYDSCFQSTVMSKQCLYIRVNHYQRIYIIGTAIINLENNLFVEKLDSNCNQYWESYHQIDSFSNNLAKLNNVILDSQCNIYVAAEAHINNDGYFFSCKLDSNGSMKWKSYYREKSDYASDLVVDEFENVYVTGYNSNDDSSNCITICYDSSGNQKWMDKTGGDSFSFYQPQIKIDNVDNLYILSEIDQEFPKINWLLRKLDKHGNQIWSTTYPGRPYLLLLDSLNNIYVCGQDSDETHSIVVKYNQSTGIDETPSDWKISLLPNPFHDLTTIQLPQANASGFNTLELFDLTGKLLQSYNVTGQPTPTISREGLPSGMYLLQLKQDNRLISTAKIVVQ